MKTIDEIIKALESIRPRTKAVKKALRIFKEGKGWYTGDSPAKIFFWSDLDDDNAWK